MIPSFSSLRARLALLVLVAMVPALGLSLFSNLEQRRLMEKNARDEALRLGRVAANSQEEIVEGTHQLLATLAQLPEVRSGDAGFCSTLLGRIREQNRHYANLGVIGLDGYAFCSALPRSGPVYLGDRSYFLKALDTQDFAAGEYQIGRITGRPSINFGYPVLDEGGEVQAVVFAALDLSWLNEFAASLDLEEGAVLVTIDRHGAVLAHFPDGDQWIGRALPGAPLVETVLASEGEGTAETVGLDGVSRLYAFTPLSIDGPVGAYVAAGIPADVIYAAANRDLARNLAGLGILTLLFLAAAWAFADRFILRRVQALAQTARRLAGGDLGARTELPHGGGELGHLARTFDEMADTLERRLRRLHALNAIDRAILARMKVEDALDVVLTQVLTQLDVDAAAVLLLDRESGMLEQVAGRGFRDPDFKREHLRLGEGVAGRAAQERRTIRVPDVAEVDNFVRTPLLAGEGFVTYYAVPLVAGDEVQGVLDIYHRKPFDPEPEWRDFLEGLAAQAAIAVDNARLFAETRRLLQQTQRQARQVQQIVDTLPEGVLLLGSDQRLVLANPVAQEFLPVLAQVTEDNVITRLGDRPLADLLQAAPAGELWEEVTVSQPERIFEVGARAIGSETRVGGWVVVVRDVTEERRRQEHIQSQERLATVGQLAAGIAHDFNNIMAVITLYSQTLERNPDFPKQRQYLGTIREQAQHASTLIGQILDFSRSSPLERAPLILEPFVNEMVKVLKRTLPETISIAFAAEGDACRVLGDPTHLQQAFMNLAVNARDAMPDGGELTISLEHLKLEPEQRPPVPEMAPGEWVCLAIADTGTGIPDDSLSRIFEPFYTTKKRGKGTGLGLAQVYGIVKQHEGEIAVESRVGAGTTFAVYLPALADTVSEGEDSAVQPSPTAKGDETILVVEDKEEVRIATQESLMDLGYRVLVAGTGREALALFDEHGAAIDLVLSDMVMPEMGGEKLYQALRSRWPQTRMILMSGYPLGETEKAFMEPGGAAWLQKPFTASALAQNVRQVLDRK